MIINLMENVPHWLFVSISPSGCSECPFSTPSDPIDDPPNPYDPDEGYYQCKLINQKIWGEDPKCETRDWVEKLIEEVK